MTQLLNEQEKQRMQKLAGIHELEFPSTINKDDEEIRQNAEKMAKHLNDKQPDVPSKKDIKSILAGMKDDIDGAANLGDAKAIVRQFMEDMHMDEDKRYKSEKIMLRGLLEDKTFAQFKQHFYNLILKFEKLGSPDANRYKNLRESVENYLQENGF